MAEARPSVDDIIARMQHGGESKRWDTRSDLEAVAKSGLTFDEGRRALYAAIELMPSDSGFFGSAASLIKAVTQQARPEYVPLVVELFPQFTDEWVAAEALKLVAEVRDRDAAVAFVNLTRTYHESTGIRYLPIRSFEEEPRHADVLFPALLDLVGNSEIRGDILELCLAYARAGVFSPEFLPLHAGRLIDLYRDLRGILIALQRPTGVSWMGEDDYQNARFDAALLLDLLEHVPTAEAIASLRDAVNSRDPLLVFHGTMSLLRPGEEVPTESIRNAAASPEVRNRLYAGLEELGWAELFPEEFRAKAAFAEADLVRWLSYPSEMGCPPDEIELMKVIAVDTETTHGILDYFVFRFRTLPPHWSSDKGWRAGVAGPFRRDDQPTIHTYGWYSGTFSSFKPWDSATPEEHLGNIQEILEEWRQAQFGDDQ